MGDSCCSPVYRHVAGLRNEGASFGEGSAVVVDLTRRCGGARRGYAGSFTIVVNVFGARKEVYNEDRMCRGLRMHRRRKESLLRIAKFPWTWNTQRSSESCLEKRSSCRDPGRGARNFTLIKKSGMVVERDRKDRTWSFSSHGIPREFELR